MKKKILSALAAVTVLSGALVISSPSASAAEIPNEGISVVAEETTQQADYFRKIPQRLINQGEFDYGGLHYKATSATAYQVSAVSNPEEVKELILYHSLTRSALDYSSIDWSKYTGLENVVIASSNASYAQGILAVLPSGTNLYIGNACNLGIAMETMPFKNIYIYYTYIPTANTFSETDFHTNLAKSNVEKIYYNSFIDEYLSGSVDTFNQSMAINKNGDELQMELFNDWTYPEYVFYPFADFDPSTPLFGSEGYWRYTSTSVTTSMSNFEFKAESTDQRVVDIDASGISNADSLDKSYKYNTIYMPKNENYNFNGIRYNELVIRVYSNTLFHFGMLGQTKEIRFLKSTASLRLNGNTQLTDAPLLEKIYIPNESKASFSVLTEDEQYASIIEYYDYEDYIAPTNTYLSEDGNIYGVKNSKYTVDEMEAAKELMKTVGLEVPAGTVIDEMMEYYEFPLLDYSNMSPDYTARNFDTIVLPKNMDATKVLEAFQFIVALNHGQMCDGENTTITVDTTNYTPGYNSVLPITITFADNTTITKDVTVRVMANDDNKAYILDGNDIYIITNPNVEDKTLSSLMAPLMEYHLMETQVEYNESPILTTKDYGYLAGNTYTASLQSGKAKVVVSDVELVEGENTPTETPDDGEVNENAEVVFKEISTIYTPETVDGSRFMSLMKDILCTVDGEKYNDYGFAIGTQSGRTNKEDYTFNAWAKVGSYQYDEDIQVKIINFQFDMGFVVFADGDIAVLFNHNKNYTNEQIETGIKAFLESQNLNVESFEMTNKTVNETKTYEATYDQGTVYIVNSGVNVGFSSSNQAVDQTEVKKGFVALTKVMYTKDFTKEEVLRALGKNVLLKDGKLYTEEYEIDYTTKEDSNYVDVVFKSGETILLKTSIELELIESEYSYIFARAFQFDYGYLLMDKQITNPEYTLNDVMLDVVPRFRGLMKPFENETTIDFTKTTTADVDGIYHVGNGSYYEYEYNVEVANIEHLVRTNEVLVDGVEPVGETVADKFNDFVDDFKVRFEENKAFKAATITLGTITGILLIWGIWAIISKFFKWLRR